MILDYYCEHVYKDAKENPCELCGQESHVTDWAKENELARKWREDNPDAGKYGGWWSI